MNYPLLLDGATGTELHRRGVNTGLPLWSANALLNDRDSQTLKKIHFDYLNAGADIITADTFRTHKRSLAKGGCGQRARELTLKAVAIARIGGIPVAVSFVCGVDGKLLSGESLSDAARVVSDLGVDIIGVNCVSTPHIKNCLDQLRSFNKPLIAYGNIGHIDERDGWTNTDAVDPEAYARYAATWGAQIIGGCCGTTPEHIRHLEKVIHAS